MPKFRHEYKYLINYGEYEALKVRMKPYFYLDPNAVNGEYSIRSLYFDDLWNSAYEEKSMGVLFRKKYRIRIYNYEDTTIKLERKIKQDKYICKESANLTRQQVMMILDGDYDFLLQSENRLCREFYIECISNFMRPRVIVDYEREPFLLDVGTVRITFDKKVRAAIGGFDIFDKDLPAISAMPSDELIMEVKFTEALPKLAKELLPPASSEFVAASKYVLCCDRTSYLRNNEYYVDEKTIFN